MDVDNGVLNPLCPDNAVIRTQQYAVQYGTSFAARVGPTVLRTM